MTVNSNIQIFEKIPETQHYALIDGSLVRSGDYVYLKLNDGEVASRITKNGVDIGITIVDNLYLLYIENCSDDYIVYTKFVNPLELEVSFDSDALENPVFQFNNY